MGGIFLSGSFVTSFEFVAQFSSGWWCIGQGRRDHRGRVCYSVSAFQEQGYLIRSFSGGVSLAVFGLNAFVSVKAFVEGKVDHGA